MNNPSQGQNIAKDDTLINDYQRTLRLVLAKTKEKNRYDAYLTLALVCREQLVDRWLETQERYLKDNAKRVCYLSLEFLMGRFLQNAVLNMDLEDTVRDVMHRQGMVLEDIYDQEFEPGLGNGGLGRLAACFLDSMATQDIPAVGYGIRYQFGIFRQEIHNGYQVEKPDNWLYRGNPWEIARPEDIVEIHFHGYCESYQDEVGQFRRRWIPFDTILALPYDTPVPGYGTTTVNTLRLWEACSPDLFNLYHFNDGDYLGAVSKNVADEAISKVLYPADNIPSGQELRLKQQYFFVAASLQDILNNFLIANSDLRNLPEKVAIQLNDTHPTIAIPELMRLLVDERQLDWKTAWDITRRTMAYTNHTLLPEALECWSVELMAHLLPRHMEIIYEINHIFLEEVRKSYPDDALLSRLSIIQEEPKKMVRMAHLAVVGSHSTNGVAALHTMLLRTKLFVDFQQIFPERFNNKTNGVTPRRWLKQANPSLAMLISEAIGPAWTRDLDQLAQLRNFAGNDNFCEEWRGSKLANKSVLADFLYRQQGVRVDPSSMFDVQVKRIHEYKRQLLNLLRVIAWYLQLKEGIWTDKTPRTVIIGGKAAPSYAQAKLIIKLANAVSTVLNNDLRTRDFLRLVFLENYGVSLAERVIPATDLSEQLSTAGLEASGTGNMKFAMNGALTIGTLDGANIEIAEAVGAENIFIFGLTAEEVVRRKEQGYDPGACVTENPLLGEVISALRSPLFTSGETSTLFQPLLDALLRHGDTYMLLADFTAYCHCQEQVDRLYVDQELWTRRAICNVSAMGYFSSDRTIGEYARNIWGVTHLKAPC